MSTPEYVQKLLNGPAMAAPAGTHHNFVNPENLNDWFILTIVLCLVVSTLAVSARVYTKIWIIKKIGWEDYTSVLAYLLWIAYCVPTNLIMKNGGGVHQWNVQLKAFIVVLHQANTGAIIYGITVFVIKLSILLQYLKIFVPSRQRNLSMFWAVNIIIGLNFIYYMAITFIEIFLCSPREKAWNVFIKTGHCLDANIANVSAAAVNCFSDFVILILPQGVIWKLQMPLKKKIGVSLVFLTGFFTCITSVLRLFLSIRLKNSGDVTYNIALMGFWTYAELSTGIVCGCLPILPKFFNLLGQKMSATSLGALLRSSKFSRSSSQSRTSEADEAARILKASPHKGIRLENQYLSLEEHESEEKATTRVQMITR